MQFTHETLVNLNGTFSLKYYMSPGGNAKLQMKDGTEDWTDLDYTSANKSTNKTFTFSGDVRAVLTGGARMYYDPIGA